MSPIAKAGRAAITQAIIDAPGGLTLGDIAIHTGLAESTILPHLGALLEARQIRRQQLRGTTRGLFFPIATPPEA
jgi:DNA-binding transcriptional ArsR family regulator